MGKTLDTSKAGAHTPPALDTEGPVVFIGIRKTRLMRVKGKPWVLRWVPAGQTRQTQETLGPMSEKHAERFRLALFLKLNGLADAEDPGGLTWAAFARKYLDAKAAELAKGSVRQIRQALERYAEDQHPTMLADVTPRTIEDFKTHRLKIRSVHTVFKEVTTLGSAFAWAVRLAYLAANPCHDVRFGRKIRPDPEAMTLAETDAFLTRLAERPTWVQASLRLAVRWGLRVGELAALERADVDFHERLVLVRVKKDWTPKAGRTRAVPLDEETAGLLQELSHRDTPLLWGPPEAPLTCATGSRGYDRAIRAEARALYKGMGLSPRKPMHFLRATALTNMRRRRVPAAIIRRIIGHCNDAMGDEHYDGTGAAEAARTAADLMK